MDYKSGSPLEQEIIEKSKKPLFDNFDTAHYDVHKRTLMNMYQKLNYHKNEKSMKDYELAILFKRFTYNSDKLILSLSPTLQHKYS